MAYAVNAPVQIVNMIKLVIMLSFLTEHFEEYQPRVTRMRQAIRTLDHRVSCTDRMIVDQLRRCLSTLQRTALLFRVSVDRM